MRKLGYLALGVAFAGAALAGMLTKDKSTLIKVAVGVAVTAATLYGGAKVGLVRV